MKKTLLSLSTFISLGYFAQSNVGIGTLTPNNQAILEIRSADKGVLISRLTTAARNTLGTALTATEDGMLVYDKDMTTFFYWDGSNLQWVQVGSGTGDNWGTQVVQTSGANISGDGTTVNPLTVTDGDSDPTNEIELPTGGTNGQVLSTDGSGNYTWANDNGGTDDQNIANLSFDNTTNILTIGIENGTSQTIDLTDLVNDADADITNEIQDLSLNTTTNILTITNNGTATNIDLTPYLDNTDAQNLTSTVTGGNATVNISGGTGTTFSINDADADPTNEIELPTGGTNGQVLATDGSGNYTWANDNGGTDNQTLSLSNNTLSISGGNSVDLSQFSTPSGAIYAFPTSTPPTGYLACNGQAVSRTTYNNLFSLIGTMYGAGDGSTTFNLPNYNGQFLRGVDNGDGTDPDAATRTDRGDGTTGDAVGTKQTNETLAHNHTVNPPATNTNSTGAHTHTVDPPSTNTNTTGAHTHTIDPPSTNTNSTGAHTHTVNPPATNTTTTGNHTHSVDPPNTSTTTNGNHTHGIRTSFDASAGNGYSYEVSGGDGRYNNLTPTKYTMSAGAHTHTVNIPAFNSAAAGNHSHSVDIPQFNSGNSGNHTHAVNIAPFNSASAGNHNHSVDIAQFNSGNSGNHTHSVDIAQFNSGNNGGAETRPTNVSVLWCIKF